jgi:hypothetical protein
MEIVFPRLPVRAEGNHENLRIAAVSPIFEPSASKIRVQSLAGTPCRFVFYSPLDVMDKKAKNVFS